MKRKLALGVLIAGLSWAAHADNCDHVRNSYDAVHCNNKVYVNADNDLNKNYQELQRKLSPQQSSILKRSQLAWIKDRDNTCSGESNVGTVIYTVCQIRKTQERNAWLQDRLRECKVIGCKTSALS
ncbi:lysozyme inhibitor LprI family protein [Acinetobacter sp. MB5]|uniref:lysozyme inhibitor LprI family protein n=1 Tax=Acinetobacter sp. MB5 TaxID=2069438 RepID=UPI000DD089B4|nr:lysozyme inhibitor LprI family protein [Acinetobacter sp. MB5]